MPPLTDAETSGLKVFIDTLIAAAAATAIDPPTYIREFTAAASGLITARLLQADAAKLRADGRAFAAGNEAQAQAKEAAAAAMEAALAAKISA